MDHISRKDLDETSTVSMPFTDFSSRIDRAVAVAKAVSRRQMETLPGDDGPGKNRAMSNETRR